jgi:hypothetical protein
MIRALVDPNTAMVRALPKELRDLSIAAKHNWILAFDNVSHLGPWLSDAFCRLSTGGAASGDRMLYSNDEEFLFSAMRSVIFNSIGEVATRGDLIDRLRMVNLTRPQTYSSEQELWQTFLQLRPAILGGLLNVVSSALRELVSIPVVPNVRLADFTRFVEAAAPALEWNRGDFTEAMRAMREEAIEIEIEASPLAVALLDECQSTLKLPYGSTATELYNYLTANFNRQRLPEGWPGNARVLSEELRRLTPALSARNLAVDIGRSNGSRYIRLNWLSL